MLAIGEENVAAWRGGWQVERLGAEVVQCLFKTEFDGGPLARVGMDVHGL
jgi:hypothetical protein